MLDVISIIFPLFVLIGVGFLCRRLDWLPADTLGHLNRYVYRIALPAMIFTAVARAPITELINPPFALLTLCGLITAFLAGAVIAWLAGRPDNAVIDGFCASNLNAAVMGIPLAMLAFGPKAAPFAALTNVITGCLLMPAVLLLLEMAGTGQQRPPLLKIVARLLRNSLLQACLLGLAASMTGLGLPKVLDLPLSMLASSASPCALLALGMFIAGPYHRVAMRASLSLSIIRLVIHPLVVLVLGAAFSLDSAARNAAVLMAALPAANGTFLILEAMDRPSTDAAQTVFMSTLLSVFTLPVWLAIL